MHERSTARERPAEDCRDDRAVDILGPNPYFVGSRIHRCHHLRRILLGTEPHRDKRFLFLLLLAGALIVGFVHVWSLRYVNDDCFVSFQYARNFVAGRGLVYNAEERVEGYTNFLWTMLIAAAMKLGFDPVNASMRLGLFFSLLTIALFGFLSWRLRPQGSPLTWIPLTSLALCLHRDFCAHSTSGMETMMFTFFLSAAFAVLVLRQDRAATAAAGVIYVLAMLTRPDGVLFLLAAAATIFLVSRDRLRRLVWLLLPSLLLFVPYWIWRYTYYGFFFPNTFYAKSVGLSYFSQGLRYAWLHIITYPVLVAALPVGGAILFRAFRRPKGAAKKEPPAEVSDDRKIRLVLLALLSTAIYALFIIRMGGDFMFGRFFVPVAPMLYEVIESGIAALRGRAMALALAVVVLLFTYFRFDQYNGSVFVGYIADEKEYFDKVEPLEQSIRDADMLKRHFGDLPVRLAFYAGQLRLIYYLDPSFAVESSSGLTDTAIAHAEVGTRERPGHEKHPTMEYLTKRRVHFYIGPTDPVPPGQIALNVITFDSMRARIVTYDNAIMSKLERDSGVSFVHLPAFIDNFLDHVHSYRKEQVLAEYRFLKPFYFDVNNDSLREERFITALNE